MSSDKKRKTVPAAFKFRDSTIVNENKERRRDGYQSKITIIEEISLEDEEDSDSTDIIIFTSPKKEEQKEHKKTGTELVNFNLAESKERLESSRQEKMRTRLYEPKQSYSLSSSSENPISYFNCFSSRRTVTNTEEESFCLLQ
jgi:GTPase SAR1 family protein